MNLRLYIFLLSTIGCFIPYSKAYLYAYKRVFRESTNTTVDLLYDIHIPVPDITIEQFSALTREEAKKKLYPTEQKILHLFQEWERNGYTCDLIWESSGSRSSHSYYYYPPATPYFLGLDTFFGLMDMRSIRFIHSDLHRIFGFFSLFEVINDKEERCFSYKDMWGNLKYGLNFTNCSFEDPAPLPDSLRRDIYKVSGGKVWHHFQNFRSQVIQALQNHFRESYSTTKKLSYTKDFIENWVAWGLCDIEILSHVLASKASRVIVYAGGAHCSKVSHFLEQNGFSCLYAAVPSNECYTEIYPELSLECLDLFEDPPFEDAPLHRRLVSYMQAPLDTFVGTYVTNKEIISLLRF